MATAQNWFAFLKDPAPTIEGHKLGDSSVNFICRPWGRTTDYWPVYWAVTREVKKAFTRAGLTIPFPQLDVRLYHPEGGSASGK